MNRGKILNCVRRSVETKATYVVGGSTDANVTVRTEAEAVQIDASLCSRIITRDVQESGKIAAGQRVTSTATDPNGNTSEFSSAIGQLLNISTRLRVQTGENVLIGGFILTGTDPKRVIVRAIGPSLSNFFPDFLADPTLELHGPAGFTTVANDNWKVRPDGGSQQAEIEATGLAPTNDLESALVQTLPANNSAYTAIVAGKNATTGIGLVEAYDLNTTTNSKLANISTRGFVETGNNVLIGGFIAGNGVTRVII